MNPYKIGQHVTVMLSHVPYEGAIDQLHSNGAVVEMDGRTGKDRFVWVSYNQIVKSNPTPIAVKPCEDVPVFALRAHVYVKRVDGLQDGKDYSTYLNRRGRIISVCGAGYIVRFDYAETTQKKDRETMYFLACELSLVR